MKCIKYIIALCFTFLIIKTYSQTARLYTGPRLIGTFSTIQAALDAATSYDSIVLSADTFFEYHINASGKYIPLQGTIEDGDTTVIDADGYGYVFNSYYGTMRNLIFQNIDTNIFVNDSNSFLTIGTKFNVENTIIIRNSFITQPYFFYAFKGIKNAHIAIYNNILFKMPKTFFLNFEDLLCSDCLNSTFKNSKIIFRNNKLIGDMGFLRLKKSWDTSNNIEISNNIGGSGILIDYNYAAPDSVGKINLSNIIIQNNQFNADYGGKALKIIDSGKGSKTQVSLNNSYIYNPAPPGHKRVELYSDSSAHISFESADSWWGSSDTAGIFDIKAPTSFKLHSWAKAHWYAVPYGKSPFTLTNVRANIIRTDGSTFPDSSFQTMRGQFYAWGGGYFSPPSVAINPANVVASDYHLPATGPYSVMAVIDADTFRPSKEKLGVVEDAALTTTTLSVAPNPFTESFKIYGESKGQYRVQLLDISGKRIVQFEGSLTAVNANMAQQCSQLSSGAYLLNVEAPNAQKQQFKLVKQ